MFRACFIPFAICLSISLHAQRYITAGGVRFEPQRIGFTVQHRILPQTTLQAIGMGAEREISGHLLAQQHFPLLGKRLNIYIGGGFHLGDNKDLGSFYGIDLITGVEYKVNAIPILLSFDFKPAVHIDHQDWITPSTAFSLRYVFLKDKKKKGGFFDRLFNGDEKEKDE